MKTDDLISELAKDLKPVKPWGGPVRLATQYAGLILLVIVLLSAVVGPRWDFANKVQQVSFWVDLALWGGVLVVSLDLLFTLATPGRSWSRLALGFGALALGGLLFWHLQGLWGMSAEAMKVGASWLTGARCTAVSVVAAISFGAWILARVHRGASGNLWLSSLILGGVSLGAGGILITLHCGDDNGMHVILWHLMVPTILLLTGAVLGVRRLLRW